MSLLPCDSQVEESKASQTHVCSPPGFDWPLSREQKKERVIQMYDKELRSVERMVEQSEQTLETTNDRVDALSYSLRKIIKEASSVLGKVNCEGGRPRSKSESSRRSLPTKSPRRSSQTRPQIKAVAGDESGQCDLASPRRRRVSFGEEEPENEPTDGEDAPLLPAPVVRASSSVPDEHTKGWKCKFKKSPLFGDVVNEPCTTSAGTVLDVPESFSSFCSELIGFGKSSNSFFLKTE
eukprot:gnl/MRDRNA2_/MRDRNA2_155692_c0_seq1.p1 gnl/MRDRNA2_/MRDRNA2_155692_c0~~gnl/MRDRNA2_/MRDRNA2_155692_c0_seq1.p1  ORF type:complete len:237 (+),score=51.55 gnl/MRDRNA2_/MRDRNA2_155692_c0_seq1:75-785(+)